MTGIKKSGNRKHLSEAVAPSCLRKVGPRLTVMLANQIMNRPNPTHCGLSCAHKSLGPLIESNDAEG